MDTILNLLSDPIEAEMEMELEFMNFEPKKPYPDKFRQYLFNNPKININCDISSLLDICDIKKLSNIPKKYWNYPDDKLINYLKKLILMYSNLESHLLTNSIREKIILSEPIKEYYNRIYDIADLIVIKSIKIDTSEKLLLKIISSLLSLCKIIIPKPIVLIRICIYLSSYFVKISYAKKPVNKFATANINKLKEFQKEPTIDKYFIETELSDYIKFCEKYVSQLIIKN